MANTNKTDTLKNRIYAIDEMRGLCIVAMVIYHLGYSMWYLYNIELGYYIMKYEAPIALVGPWMFIFISGISSMLSKSNLKRGLKLAVVAVVISAVTIMFVPQSAIYFGVIHFFAVAMILFHFIKPIVMKIPSFIGAIISLMLFAITYTVPQGYLSFFGYRIYELPSYLYENNYLMPLGFPPNGFMSADYFPILPYIFMFLAGGFIGVLAKNGKFPKFLYKSRIKPLSYLGRHSLSIYILHQPVIIFALWLIVDILNINLNF